MTDSAPPLLVVVTGMPAAGKTTLARLLGERLRLPVIEKDRIKETLFDALGIGDVDWSRRLGAAVYPLIFLIVDQQLTAGRSVIAEANFFRGTAEAGFARLPPHRLVQIHCDAPLEVLISRYRNRPERHPGHFDRIRERELEQRYTSRGHGPLDLERELIELDTSVPVDVDPLVEHLRSLVREEGSRLSAR